MNYYPEISRVITVLASLTITIGLYAQCCKLFRTRSAGDFTPALVGSLLFSEVVWLNYGLVLGEWPIVLISCLNMAPVVLITLGYRRYGRCASGPVR
jgi:uncharacterized protein with PQ loop repeat